MKATRAGRGTTLTVYHIKEVHDIYIYTYAPEILNSPFAPHKMPSFSFGEYIPRREIIILLTYASI